MKPFIDESPNGFKQSCSAEEVANMVDTNAGTRLALVLYQNGMLTDENFLRVIRPGWDVRPRGEFDNEVA